jgi:hypothetical protein
MSTDNNHNGCGLGPGKLGVRGSRSPISFTLALFAFAVLAFAPMSAPFAFAVSSGPSILQVGPDRTLKTPSAAAALAKSGDTVEIDAGTYPNDYASWPQDNLTIRGVGGGMAHVRSTGLIPNGKAIWIVSGNNMLIENMEFSGAQVVDTNGAGIRHEGGNLTLRNTFFHHNEFSILTGADPQSSLDIFSSRFWFQKRQTTFSHGLYIGELKRFTLEGSHIKGTDRGHQIKSRALENHIQYNRIEDIRGGNSSRLVDLPNCGLSYIIGNDMQKAETTENVDAIGYGAEGCAGRSERQRRLFVVSNTYVNEAGGGALVRNHAAGEVLVANNLMFGRGRFLMGKGQEVNNVSVLLTLRQPGSWLPPPDSAAINKAGNLPDAEGVALRPTREFSLPVGTAERIYYGALDVGARELSQAADATTRQGAQ